jgi:hypothetical protein
MMWTTMARGAMRLSDSLLPLLIGMLQFGMIRHAAAAGGREPENAPLLASLRRWNSTTEWLMVAGIALALLAAWLDSSFDAGQGRWPWAAVLVTIIPIAYIVRTLKFGQFVSPLEPNG